jgi:hypothetical protein
MRDFPAYARTITQQMRRGHRPICLAVLLSSRWDYYAHLPKVCIKPKDWAPRRYDLDLVRERLAIAVVGDDCDPRQLAELLFELMLARPAALWVYSTEGEALADQSSPLQLAWWIRDLGAPALGGRSRAGLEARRALEEGIAAAARAIVRQAEALEQRAGLEASVRFQLAQYRIEDQVRELLRAPLRNAEAAL